MDISNFRVWDHVVGTCLHSTFSNKLMIWCSVSKSQSSLRSWLQCLSRFLMSPVYLWSQLTTQKILRSSTALMSPGLLLRIIQLLWEAKQNFFWNRTIIENLKGNRKSRERFLSWFKWHLNLIMTEETSIKNSTFDLKKAVVSNKLSNAREKMFRIIRKLKVRDQTVNVSACFKYLNIFFD